jgi:hypothetical protein
MNDMIEKMSGVEQGVSQGIPLNNETQKTSFGNVLLSFAKIAEKQGGLPLSPGVSAADLYKMASSVQNATFTTVERSEFSDPIYQVTATSADNKTVTFKISEEQKQGTFGDRFDSSPAKEAIKPYVRQIMKMNGGAQVGSTSFDGKATTPGNSWLGGTKDFPSVNLYGVSGNLEKLKNGTYMLMLNIIDPIDGSLAVQGHPYPDTGASMDEEGVQRALNGLNDEHIFYMINRRKPTEEEKKALFEAAK